MLAGRIDVIDDRLAELCTISRPFRIMHAIISKLVFVYILRLVLGVQNLKKYFIRKPSHTDIFDLIILLIRKIRHQILTNNFNFDACADTIPRHYFSSQKIIENPKKYLFAHL